MKKRQSKHSILSILIILSSIPFLLVLFIYLLLAINQYDETKKSVNSMFESILPFIDENLDESFFYEGSDEKEEIISNFANDNNLLLRIYDEEFNCLYKFGKSESNYIDTYAYSYDYFDSIEKIKSEKRITQVLETGEANAFYLDAPSDAHSELVIAIPYYDRFNFIIGFYMVTTLERSDIHIISVYGDIARLFFIILIFYIGTAFFVVVNPLHRLAKQMLMTADKNGKISYTELKYIKKGNELGDISRSFNSVINKLNYRINETEMLAIDLSHEIKNPLAAIRNLTEILEDETLSKEEKYNFLKSINEESIKIENIIKNIRDASRIENKTYENDKEKILCDLMLQNLCSVYSIKYPEINFITRFNANEIKIIINPELFETMINNLITNAVSFGDNIMMTSKTEKKNLIITIEDNGPGIPIEEREKIFKRFYSNRKKEDRIKHDGLGLHLVEYIINSINGTIKVETSYELGGASFVISIPTTKREKIHKI